jgi:hypothetical protein
MEISLFPIIKEFSKPNAAIDKIFLQTHLINYIQYNTTIPHQNVSFEVVQIASLRIIFNYIRNEIDCEIGILLCKTLQILCNQQLQRQILAKDIYCIESISIALKRLTSEYNTALVQNYLKEIIIVITLLCCEEDYIHNIISFDAIISSLVFLLKTNQDATLLEVLLSSLQAICCKLEGKRQLLSLDSTIIHRIATHLSSHIPTIRARACGILHNISVDSQFISILREGNIIALLSTLLQDNDMDTLRAVVGTLQNLSRELSSRNIIVNIPCIIEGLIDLVLGADVLCQTAAIGAILNIMSPGLSTSDNTALRLLLTDALVIGVVKSSLFDIK